MAKKKKTFTNKKINLTKKQIKQLRQLTVLAVIACMTCLAVFGSYKIVSKGVHWIMSRNNTPVSVIIMGDGQKVATASHTVAKKIATSKLAQENAKKKAMKSTEETRKQELESTDLSPLEKQMAEYVEENEIDPSYISYKVVDIATGKSFGTANNAYNMLAGSVYKLPLSLLWYDRIDDGKASFDDMLEWGDNIHETDGRMQDVWEEGDMISLADVLSYTLKYSDNVGGHMLYESYGGWAKFKKDAARYSSHKQEEEFYSDVNYLNAEYMCDVMMHIYKHQDNYPDVIRFLSVAAPDTFLNGTLACNMIQKVGYYKSHINACGLQLDGRPYIFCIFTNLGDFAYPVMGDLNAMIYDYMNEELPPLSFDPAEEA